MKIAANISNFSGCVSRPDDLVSCIEFAGKTRFKYADMSMYGLNYAGSAITGPNWRGWAEKIGEAAQRENIKLIQAHSLDGAYDEGERREYTVELIKRQIEMCGMLNIPQIVVHNVMKLGNTWKQQRETNRGFFNSLTDAAEKHNIMILLENGCFQNSRGMYYYTTAENLLTTIADLGFHPLFNVCWDTGHAHMQGADQYSEILELGERLKGLHVHDNYADRDTHSMPFTGSCGYDAIIKGLLKIGYGGFFTSEAYSISPASFAQRPGYEKKGGESEKLIDMPPEIMIQSENLTYEIAKYMLSQYDCFEE